MTEPTSAEIAEAIAEKVLGDRDREWFARGRRAGLAEAISEVRAMQCPAFDAVVERLHALT